MSWGSVIGAVGGGVIGFILGGPVGAFYGASLGFAIGMYVDPITPDVTPVGAPDTSELVMSGEVGTPVYDLAGTAKIIGHLLCYGGEHAEAEEEEVEGGKGGGGSESYVTGYKYYMSWAVGIAVGQVDTLLAVYENDDIVWEGELACPASGGQETITLDGMGSATFYFGTDDQALNSKVGAIIDDASLNIPYRNLCWCFMDDCYIGNYNRAPSLSFIIKKIPQYAFSDDHEISVYDCNPAHLIWYILHDLAGLSESWLHTADFTEVAATLKSESRGLSVAFSAQQSAIGYLESINNHIDSILRYDVDGKFHPKLIREDYVAEDLPLIDEGVMTEEPVLKRKSWIDTVNEMKVQYTELEADRDFGLCWVTGQNVYGQLGLGDHIQRNEFAQVDDSYWRVCVCHDHSTMILKSDNTLWGTGLNNYGNLGLGDNTDRDVFTQVGADLWESLDCGERHTVAVKDDDTLWATGYNGYGQLGLGDSIDRNAFTLISGLSGSVYCGIYSSFVIQGSALKAAGYNNHGQLGLGDHVDRDEFTLVENGAWEAVAAGSCHTIAIKGGSLYATGYNNFGQLGLGDFIDRDEFTLVSSGTWIAVACGWHFFVFALKSDGTLWATGHNGFGQLGLGDIVHRNVLTQIDGSWKAVYCGRDHTMAIKSDNTLWATGLNDNGQLGLGDYIERHEFTEVGGFWRSVDGGDHHTAAIKL